MSDYNFSGALRARMIRSRDCFTLGLGKWNWEDYNNAGVCYINAKGDQIITPPFVYNREKHQLEIEHVSLPAIEKVLKTKWRVGMYYEDNGEIIYKRFMNRKVAERIGNIKNDAQSQRFRYGEPIYEFQKREKKYCVVPYFTKTGRMSLMIKQKVRLLLKSVKAHVECCSIKGSRLHITMSVKAKGYVPGMIVLQFRTEKGSKERSFNLDTTWEKDENGRYVVQGTVDLSTLDFCSVYWDTFLCMYSEEDISKDEPEFFPYYVNAYNTSSAFKNRFLRLREEVAYRTRDGFILFPFVTQKSTLAFKYREVNQADSFWFRLKERIARRIYQSNKEYWDNKNIYLVYEKYCIAAQDNGYYFFQYCMEHRKQVEKNAHFFYVIDKKEPDYKKVSKYKKRVINFLSLKHMIYLQAAKLLISTDSRAHAYVWRQKGSILYDVVMEKKNVFLQHGVIGLKNITKLYHRNSSAGCDLFIASSEKEKQIIHDKLKYPNKQIVITGLARWDVLTNKPYDKNEILVMPTWRSWLDSVSDAEFCRSKYFRHYEQLLTDSSLLRFLEQEDLYITFYLHPIIRKYIDDFRVDSDRVNLIAFGEIPLNEIIMRCRMMVTDYSSASWDMLYLKKPVIFYQFDVEDYKDIHGSYMNFDEDLFGDRASTVEQLIFYIKKTAGRDFAMDEQYVSKREKAFTYIDNDNSKRIWKAIMKMK